MRIYDSIDFRRLPAELEPLFAEASRHSFFNLPGWYDLVARYGLRPGWRPLVVSNDDHTAAFALQAADNTSAALSCSNPYTCEHAVLTAPLANGRESVRQLAFDLARGQAQRCRLQLSPLLPGAAFDAAADGFRAAGFAVKPYFSWGNWHERVTGLTFEEFATGRPSALRNTYKRKLAAIAKTSEAVFQFSEDGRDAEGFLSAYDEVYRESWKEAEPFPAFVRELVRFADSAGALRWGVLRISGKPAAVQFWIVWNGRALLFKLAYAAPFKELSPGTVLTMRMLERIFAIDRPGEIDFGRGDDAYKQLFVSARREHWGLDAANPRTVRGGLLAAAMVAARLRDRMGVRGKR